MRALKHLLLLLTIAVPLSAADVPLIEMQSFSTGCGLMAMDLDGDGLDEIIDGRTMYVSRGGAIAPMRVHVSPDVDLAVAAADFNNDRISDLLLPNGVVAIGDGTGEFLETALTAPGALQAADFNGDRRIDVATYDERGIHLFYGRGDGTFTAGATLPWPGDGIELRSGGPLAVADFNNDGLLDIAASNRPRLLLYFANADGSYRMVSHLTPRGVKPPLAADLNGDGNADLFCPGAGSDGAVMVLYGDGTGRFPLVRSMILAPSGTRFSDLTVPYSYALAPVLPGGRTGIVVGAHNGAVLLLDGAGGELREVSRVYPQPWTAVVIRTGHFRSRNEIDIAAAGHIAADVRLAYLHAGAAMSNSSSGSTGRVRAVRRGTPAAAPRLEFPPIVTTQYDAFMVLGCSGTASGRWTATREGIFVDIVDSTGRAVDGAMDGDTLVIHTTIDERFHDVEARLRPDARGFSGMLYLPARGAEGCGDPWVTLTR
ncbi:MAG TPA: VCBS repeat-containing protein [Thermoanaerobaculia bacterium]|jgi:hypothetical protein